jgi:hypothetical protein
LYATALSQQEVFEDEPAAVARERIAAYLARNIIGSLSVADANDLIKCFAIGARHRGR